MNLAVQSGPYDLATLPPMLRLYLEYKAKYPDALLFFQVGDFYELFFDDARTTSRALNLTLTSRDKNSANPIPMCGVPISAVDGYLERLVNLGHSVAVVGQVGEADPKKGMVQRALQRIVTPSVRVLSGALGEGDDTLLAAVEISPQMEVAVAWSTVKNGRIRVRDRFDFANLHGEIMRLAPQEVILPRMIDSKLVDRRLSWVRRLEAGLRPGAALRFRSDESINLSQRRELNGLAGYSALSNLGRRAARQLVGYLDEVTVSSKLSISEISSDDSRDCMGIDASTRDHLELIANSRDGGTQGTLLGVLDFTRSFGGRRLLKQWILQPLVDQALINARLQVVRYLRDNLMLREDLQRALSEVGDIERISTRIELGAVSPRELGALRDASQQVVSIAQKLTIQSECPALLSTLLSELVVPSEIQRLLGASLVDNPPLVMNEGGIFNPGFDPELDRLREIKEHGRSWMTELELQERSKTGISSLKVRYNSVFGYYIEITNANLERVPPDYIRKQTTANSERYITPELKQREEELLGAESKICRIEQERFTALVSMLVGCVTPLRVLARNLSTLDVLLSLAQVAERDSLIEPVINTGKALEIRAGRHPVLARMLEREFVANDLVLGESAERCMIITGPNMGGKSTFLRQAALIVIMAQMGSFVPAERAQIGVTDRIFTRIGAGDNMAEGESTFMLEMREAAYILAGATERSLVLIDELGRGTATLDGVSLAQAILEWLASKIQCRTLFATHFHELTQLSERFEGIGNLSVGSIDRDGDVYFTHQIQPGPADRSYGLEVAKLAALPEELLTRAHELFEQHSREQGISQSEGGQLALFGGVQRDVQRVEPSKPGKKNQGQSVQVTEKIVEPADYKKLKSLEQSMAKLDLNSITPLQALNLLADLVKRHDFDYVG